jgi:cardiolipin synthase
MTNFTENNDLKLLRNGEEYFPALESAIHLSQQEIFIESYIYEDDPIGQRIANALKKASRRGVRVHVLLDGFGSQGLPVSLKDSMQKSGVNLMFYRPQISPWTFKKNRLRRLHRKLVVIDGEVGFLGGINIIDDHNVPDNAAPRLDFAVEIRGQLVHPMLKTMQQLWRRLAWLQFKRTPKQLATANVKLPLGSTKIKAALVLRDNVLHRHDIEQAYLDAIANAQDEILIANSYFVPGWRFRKALTDAAKRGVKVTLLLQGRIEYWVMLATQALYGQLLQQGIHIYEYRKSFMHSKVAVIDGVWATVGSSNIDPFSLLLAREANVVVHDKDFAGQLKKSIQASIQDGGVKIDQVKWGQGDIRQRFVSSLVYGFLRIILGIIGRAEDWQK